MAVRSTHAHWKMKDIGRRHWLVVGVRHGVVTEDGRPAQGVVDGLVERTPWVVDKVRSQLPADFPMRLADSILHGLQKAVDRLAGSDATR